MKSREERISDYLNKNVWGLFPDKLDIGLSWFHGPTLLCVAKLIIPPHGALQKHQQWLVQSDGNLNRVEDEPALYAYSDDQNWRDSNDLSTHLNEYMEGSWLQDFPSFAFQGNWLQIYLMQCALAYVPCAPNSACVCISLSQLDTWLNSCSHLEASSTQRLQVRSGHLHRHSRSRHHFHRTSQSRPHS